jgi:hypothetical protein
VLFLCLVGLGASINFLAERGKSATAGQLPTGTFTATPAILAQGIEATLEWYVPGDLDVTIEAQDAASGEQAAWQYPSQWSARDSWPPVPPVVHGTLKVRPERTTVYTLEARRANSESFLLASKVKVTVPGDAPDGARP